MFTGLRRLSSQRLAASLSTCRKYTTAVSLPPSPTHLEASPTRKPKHHDLQTFLSNTHESRTDTVYLGTKYEYTVQSSLQRLGFSLAHNGGSSDYGIDLLGTWKLPDGSTTLKVLVQCKSLKAGTSPSVVRELEGSFAGAPIEWRGQSGVIALLASSKSATKGVREALGRSRRSMGFVCVDREGKVLQMLWNRRAEEEGLVGVGICVRYPGEDQTCKVVDLTWKGEPVANEEE